LGIIMADKVLNELGMKQAVEFNFLYQMSKDDK
jgi:hypothetical protein